MKHFAAEDSVMVLLPATAGDVTLLVAIELSCAGTSSEAAIDVA
jgi:hypothetical protein